jgi:hypothetical protein
MCTKAVYKISGFLFTTVSHGTILLTKSTSSKRADTKDTPAHCSTWLDMDSVGSVLCWVHFFYNHVIVVKLHMIIRWLAWTCDAIDFFSVSLSIDRLERQFNRSAHDIVLCFKQSLITTDDSGTDDFNHPHALIPISRCRASQFDPFLSFVDAHEFLRLCLVFFQIATAENGP